ncbi:MAG: hypothetical protein ABWY52_01405, partial [Candidatus Limnocylindrales bacterium]
RQPVAKALDLPRDARSWAIFRDLVSGREGMRKCAALHDDGFAVSLHAYERRVLLDWRVVDDNDGALGELAARIGWDGTVPSVDEAIDGIRAEWREAREPRAWTEPAGAEAAEAAGVPKAKPAPGAKPGRSTGKGRKPPPPTSKRPKAAKPSSKTSRSPKLRPDASPGDPKTGR